MFAFIARWNVYQGKMFQNNVCQQSGTSYKIAYLKRLLGDRDIVLCHIRPKAFFIEDNLQTYRRNHHRKGFHQCDLFNQVLRENNDPPFKRRITKYDDREHSFIIVLIGEQVISTFIVLSTRNRVTFHDLDNRGRPNILKSLRLLFQSVIKNITEFMEPSDLVCMLVQCPEFDSPLSLPFMTLSQLSAERFLI